MEELLWSLRMARAYCAQLEEKAQQVDKLQVEIEQLKKDSARMAEELAAITPKEPA